MAGRTPKEQLGVDLPEPEPIAQEPELEVQDERPDWLPEKFKDPSELAASYKNLENELRERGEAQKKMESQISQLTSLVENLQPEPQQQQPQQYQQVNEQLLQAYENDPVGTMILLASQVAQQQINQYEQTRQPAVQQQQQLQGELIATTASRLMEAKFTDWKEYEPRVGDLLERNPGLLSEDDLTSIDRTSAKLEAIYKQVKYDDLVNQLESAPANQEQMKRQAQTISGAAGRPAQSSDVDEKMAQLLAASKNMSYSAFRGGR